MTTEQWYARTATVTHLISNRPGWTVCRLSTANMINVLMERPPVLCAACLSTVNA